MECPAATAGKAGISGSGVRKHPNTLTVRSANINLILDSFLAAGNVRRLLPFQLLQIFFRRSQGRFFCFVFFRYWIVVTSECILTLNEPLTAPTEQPVKNHLNTLRLRKLPVAVLVFYARAAWARSIARNLAPCRGIAGICGGAALASFSAGGGEFILSGEGGNMMSLHFR